MSSLELNRPGVGSREGGTDKGTCSWIPMPAIIAQQMPGALVLHVGSSHPTVKGADIRAPHKPEVMPKGKAW